MAQPTTRAPETQRPATPDRPRLAFSEIDVRKAPGIAPGFAIRNLSPDINIVFGPNASGKSTTARAIQALIWPYPSSLRGHALAGEFTLNDEPWTIEADLGRVSRTRDGELAEPPVLAPIDDRVRYTLGLPDLLASENQPLAQSILKESTGGFDLDATWRARGYRADIPVRLEETRDVDAALLRVRTAERAQQDAAAQQRQLAPLREREQRGRQAQTEAGHLRAALAFAHVRFEAERAAKAVQALPAALARATGDEPRELAELNERYAEVAGRKRELDGAIAAAEQERQATGLADAGIHDGILRGVQGAIGELKRLDQEISASQRDLQTVIAERDSHRRRLAADLNEAQINALDTEGLRELAQLAHSYEDIRTKRAARDEVERWLGGITPPENLGVLRQGVEYLNKRLQTPNAAEASRIIRRARWAAVAGGVLVIAASAWLGITVHPLWWLFAILGFIIILVAWRYALPSSIRDAATYERFYRETGLPEPESWTPAGIRQRLDDLNGQLQVAQVEAEKANRWADLKQERKQLDQAYHDTEARRASVIDRYGVAPDLGEESLKLLAEQLSRWQAADTRVRAAQARLNAIGKERLGHESGLSGQLRTYGYTTASYDEHLADLEQRVETLDAANSRIAARREELAATIQPELDRIERARNTVYNRLGVQSGDDDAVAALIDQLPAYRDAVAIQQERDHQRRKAEDALALMPELKDLSVEQIQRRLEAAETEAAAIEPVTREIAEIQTRLGDAKRKRDVEAALGKRDDALAHLRERRDEVANQVAGDTLLKFVRAETRDAALPIVFHRARDLFTIITRGRYELQFEEGPPPAFTAGDTTTGLTLGLDQLSSGTRVQLLMAIRLAFVENTESGPKLPILLDETLGNSDELRAGAIIDAAVEIARNGRQVFYFTAQGDEVSRWESRLEQIPADERPSHMVIDLAEVRSNAGFERLPVTASQPIRDRLPVAAPDELSRHDYANALRVPAIDPWQETLGGLHLWHVVADGATLHRLLEQDIRTWGQLAGLAQASGTRRQALPPLGLGETDWRHAQARAGMITAALETWRIGRARPVTTRDLAESGAIPGKLLDDVAALLPEVDHRGDALIARLRDGATPLLSDKATGRLESWLLANGFIATGEPLDRDALRTRLLASVSDDIERGDLSLADLDEVIASLPA